MDLTKGKCLGALALSITAFFGLVKQFSLGTLNSVKNAVF